MITWENSIFINRPQQEVWDFVSNIANAIHWESGTEFAEWTSEEPHGVGSTARGVSKILGRKMEFPIVVTAWDPPNELGRKSVSGPIQAESTVKLEPGEGGTQLSVRYQGEAGGFFKIAEGLLRRQLEKQTTANYNALKLLLEAGQA
jgi:carbon monoxide dehydrogenase subunit G